MNAKFDFDDILIQPSTTTTISSRKEINPYDILGFLPLITAPMDTVINVENQQIFSDNKIMPCQPRGVKVDKNVFNSFSLSQFNEKFIYNRFEPLNDDPHYILIDTANGHIDTIIKAVKNAKEKYGGSINLMVGNVANPDTYARLSEAGADYVRVGIGNGGGCLTTQQLGVGYPMGSLIKECYDKSCQLNEPAKIVADGGMKKYSDIIKALALGADYVMIGSIFNKALESASKTYIHVGDSEQDEKEASEEQKQLFIESRKVKLYKKFRGMSTKEVQKDWGNTELKTSEGIVKYQEVEYTIEGWVENFEHYLRSAMSYTNSRYLSEFIGQVKYNHITNNAFNRFNK